MVYMFSRASPILYIPKCFLRFRTALSLVTQLGHCSAASDRLPLCLLLTCLLLPQ